MQILNRKDYKQMKCAIVVLLLVAALCNFLLLAHDYGYFPTITPCEPATKGPLKGMCLA